jgi:hypothetical protein
MTISSNRVNVTLADAKPMVKALIASGIPTNLLSSPGLGKSDLIKAIAKELNLKLIDIRLSTCDPCDLSGLPNIQNGRSVWSPNQAFPLQNMDEVPEGYEGWLLFLDEITNAPMAVQAASYRLILDREVGQYKLHDKVFIASAGNLITDAAAVTGEMSTALKSRMAHINIQVSADAWLEWADKPENSVHYAITSYIRFKRETGLYTFNPDVDADTYACPRSWGMAAKIIDNVGIDNNSIQMLLGSVLSMGVALEFMTFVKYYSNLPTLKEILRDPHNARMPTERGPLFALSGLVSTSMDKDNAGTLLEYVKRMPSEMQAATAIPAFKRTPAILTVTAVREWLQPYIAKLRQD